MILWNFLLHIASTYFPIVNLKYRQIIIKQVMTSVVKMTNCLNKIICYNFKKYGIEQPRAALVAQRLKHLPAIQETWIRSLGREDPRRKNPLQYSCLENPMDGGAWWATVCGVAKSWTGLSDFTFTLLGRV